MAASLADTARTVVAGGADPSPFNIRYRFYSNGQRGHRHVSLDCPLFRSKCKLTDHTFTLLELKLLCEPCVRAVLPVTTLAALDAATRVEEAITRLRRITRGDIESTIAFELLEEHDRLVTALRDLVDHEELRGYLPWCQSRLAALRAAAIKAAGGGRERLLFIAAADTAFRNADPGDEVKAILGRYGETTLYEHLRAWWSAEMSSHGLASYATRQLLERVANLTPDSVEQLKFDTTDRYRGEPLDQFIQRCWQQRVVAEVHRLTSRWGCEFRRANTCTDLYVMALDLVENPTGLFASFLSAYTEVRTGSRYIVAAPMVVMTWISHNATGLRRVPELVAAPDGIDTELHAVAFTAATLWDPATPGGSYERFHSAFIAAALL